MTKKPTFILGVGAQKSGTTWLYEYLKHSKNVDMGTHKEYHIWSARYRPYGLFSDWYITDKTSVEHDPGMLFIFNMINEHGFYENYFKSLLTDQINVTGDISPSYCGLSYRNFLDIKQRIESAGFDLKVVFILRDPVERCWSQAKMGAFRKNERDWSIFFKDNFKTLPYKYRTEYDKSIPVLEKVFDKDHLFIVLYEEMFTIEKLKQLSAFCGVDYDLSFRNKKFMQTNYYPIQETLAEECYNFYYKTYMAMYEKFPQTKTLWKNYGKK